MEKIPRRQTQMPSRRGDKLERVLCVCFIAIPLLTRMSNIESLKKLSHVKMELLQAFSFTCPPESAF